MDYITITQASKKWKISARRIQRLCNEGRVEGAVRFGGKIWAIPAKADKTCDLRIKNGKYIKLQKSITERV